MKRMIGICLALTLLLGWAFALQAQVPGLKDNTSEVKLEVKALMAELDAARKLEADPDPALYARLRQLLGEGSSLDDATELDLPDSDSRTVVPGTCAGAAVVGPLPYTTTGSLDLSDDCNGRPYNDVFYVFTAPAAAFYSFDMCGSTGNTWMRIWLNGTCCVGDTLANDDGCGGSTDDPKITTPLAANQVVYIECGRRTATTSSSRSSSFHVERISPAGDLCSEAQAVAIPSQNSGSTANATLDVAPICADTVAPTAPGVWYKVVGTGTLLTASTCNTTTNYDTKLTIYSGSCDNLVCVAGNDDAAGCNLRSTVSWCGQAGVTYYILVHGYSTFTGNYRLDISSGDPCCLVTMDYCANPIIIPGVFHYENSVTSCCATNPIPVVSEHNCGTQAYHSGPDVIYKFVLSDASVLNILGGVGNGDAQVMVFTDCTNPANTCVASSDTGTGDVERINGLTLAAGTYYVSVSYYGPLACGTTRIIIDSDHQLPVELNSFTATPGDASASLYWSTASESNNSRFEVERDGDVIAVVTSHGVSATEQRYSWNDIGLMNDRTYHYTLYSVDLTGSRSALRSTDATPTAASAAAVSEYSLYQNYPNPFNPTTQIAFDLKDAGFVTLKIFNLMGQGVEELVQGNLGSGHHEVNFNAANLPSGVYVYRLSVNGFVSEKKMLLMK
jgi:hypothetical protein